MRIPGIRCGGARCRTHVGRIVGEIYEISQVLLLALEFMSDTQMLHFDQHEVCRNEAPAHSVLVVPLPMCDSGTDQGLSDSNFFNWTQPL